MKKTLYILFTICLFTACSSDDTITPTTTPDKGDNLTVDQIVGKYEFISVEFDDGQHDPISISQELQFTFKPDYTGIEFRPKSLENKPFNWSYKDGVIYFKHNSTRGNVEGWFKQTTLKYRAKSEYANHIGTYSYKKVTSAYN